MAGPSEARGAGREVGDDDAPFSAELADAPLAASGVAPRPRIAMTAAHADARAEGRRPRRVHLQRHARRPAGTAAIALAVLLAVVVVAAAPWLGEKGAAALAAALGSHGAHRWAAYAALGAVLFGAWAPLTARALARGSWGLGLASLGLVVLMVGAVVAVLSLLGSETAATLFEVAPLAVLPAAAAVVGGLAAAGLRRAVEELRASRPGLGLAVGALALAGLALAARVARIDLPLPMPGGDFVLWAPLD
jgi:hypothetical protein